MARIRSRAPLIGTLAIALIAGGAVGAALAGSGSTTRTIIAVRTSTTVAVRTIYKTRVRTQTRVRTVTAPAPTRAGAPTRPGARSKSAPSTPGVEAPAGSSPVVPTPAPGPAQHFTGTGPRTLGDITVTGTATLRWTNASGPIRILFDGNAIGLDSTAHSGETVVPAQTYHNVRVDAAGHWTINIS